MRLRTLLLTAVLIGGAARAEEEAAVSSWAAPPYWVPPAAAAEGRIPAPVAGRTAEVGRQALAAGPTALPFIALPPCRIVDTRGNAPLTGGFLPSATVRSYTVTNVCGVPPGAQALSLNATVVKPTGPGFLTLWPQGGAFPPVSTLNFLGNDVIVNAAVVPLSATGGISMALGVSGGDVILDTNGYYAAVSSVTSLNTLAGNLTLAAGSNVTLTPSGQTLTISAAGGGGVSSLNSLTGALTLAGGGATTVTPGGSTLTIATPVGWGLAGNSGTNPAANYIGTSDNQPLEIRVAGSSRVARFEPTVNGTPNVVLGGPGNAVLAGASMATVSGGGYNVVTGASGTVGGGGTNQAGAYATVGGGYSNAALGQYATVGGGFGNTASGFWSVVPGGAGNVAGGVGSFAAGSGAWVRDAGQAGTPSGDSGTFIWADDQGGYVVSTGPNQFLIRAGGGVGINTTSPGYPLEVSSAGDTQVGIRSATAGGRVWTIQSSSGQAVGSLAGSFQIVDRTAGQSRLAITSGGQVAVNATDPLGLTFAVNGTAGKPGGGSWSLYSDARLKREIRQLRGTLDRLLALRGVTFEYVDPEAVHELPGTRIGMIAQEVEPVFPDWVSEGPDGYRRLTIRGFEALTVEALRDLRREKDDEIRALKSALETQRAEIDELRAIDRLRADRAERGDRWQR